MTNVNNNLRLVAYGELNFGTFTKMVNVYSENFGEMNPTNSKITFKNFVSQETMIDARYFFNIEHFTNVN
jgi:hypothetical protein